MRDAHGVLRALAIFVRPFISDPIAGLRDITRDLDCRRFEFDEFERQLLAGS